MKQELSLSLLSRGRGQFVSSSGKKGRQDGRLDVCFTPQDYYNWKSQDALLPLTNSGHLLAEAQPAMPKTFSTRRGPLLLYSQYLVTLESSCPQETKGRKRLVVRQYTQQVKEQLRTVKELTSALIRRGNKQGPSAPAPPALAPVLHHPAPAVNDTGLPELFSPVWPKRSSPHLCSEDATSEELHLPNISERFCTVALSPSQIQGHKQSKAERRRLQLPLLLPAEEDGVNVRKQRGEQTRRRDFEKMKLEQRGADKEGRHHAEKGQQVSADDTPCPVEASVSAAGHRGPGRQHSFPLLQDGSDGHRQPIKGLLPLELRDPSDGKCVGCLIVGPDGKIIQLSLFANSQSGRQNDGPAEERALQVVSAEGEKLPWVVVLQPEDGATGCRVESGNEVLVADKLQKQLKHQVLEPHKLRESSEASRRSDKETDSEDEAKRAEMVATAPSGPVWKGFKEAVRCLEEEGGAVEVKEGDGTQVEAAVQEEGRSRTSSGSTRLPFVFKSTEKLHFQGGSASIQTSAGAAQATKGADEKGGMTTQSTAAQPTNSQRKKKGEWHTQQTGSAAGKPAEISQDERSSRREVAAAPPVLVTHVLKL